ncbi:MAG: hypothetical protein K2H02_03260 [Anaeroplasmataceae bacterium]|nr:hypothetical protein [Anaeroplasmataceae bacterium]
MEKENNTLPKAFALYTFIDMETDDKFGATPNTYSKDYSNPITRHKILKRLIAYAIKRCYGVDIKEKNPMNYIENGRGYIDGIYFSFSLCLRVVCVSVSKYPTGVSMQIPFPIYDELEYAEYNFCKNELEEYQKREFGEYTYYYLMCKKKAYQNKHGLKNEENKTIDFTQGSYTYHTDAFSEGLYIFVATDNTKFEKIDVDVLL